VERRAGTLHRTQETPRHRDGFITAVAFGGFLIIVGLVFAMNANLWQNINDFFGDITTRTFPFGGPTSSIALPAPEHPAAHISLYNALFQFDVAFGVLQLLILALRVGVRSRINRISETAGNAIFWLGAAGLVNTFLLTGTLSGWFQYWAALIIIVGVSLITRAFVYFVKRR
jgi:hypothetical protein